MGKYDDLPQDLIERAIAELNREIPERDILIERLGKFGHEVEAFVMRLEAIKFFANVGKPIQLRRGEKVERVRDWDSAIKVSLEERPALRDDKFEIRRSLIKRHNLQTLSDAAFDLYNEYVPLSIPEEVRGRAKVAVFIDIEGALDEIILQDLLDDRFFLDLFYWYEQGHWCCAVKDDGTLVIF